MPQRVALVTGASGGIGRAISLRLATDGFRVALQFHGNKTAADEVVDIIAEGGGDAIAIGADIGDEEDVAALFATTRGEFDGVDVVVNSAGIMPLSPLSDTDVETFDRIIRTNVRGTFLVARQAATEVRDGGSIILFSTSVTRLQPINYSAYAMSKGAVEALPLILARELAGRGISVNAVAPGPTDTPLFRNGKPQELIDRIASANPMGRLGTVDDIADVVSALAGPVHWINGQTIFANGGAA